MSDEALFSLFEDLLEDGAGGSDGAPSNPDSGGGGLDDDGDEDGPLHKLDANALTLNELLQELEKRGEKARGFFADDARVLQEHFDREHELYVEMKRRERREARELETKQAMLQRRRVLMETRVQEEREEIERDRRMRGWLDLIRDGGVPAHSRIEVNDVSARALAKALLTDSAMVSLDVSHAGLSDLAGAFLCRALRKNRSMIKLELGGNRLGPKTCRSLGDALCTNDALQFVNLESNPLTGEKADDMSGIVAIAHMVRQNKTLRYLSLWRCDIGPEGGEIVADAVCSNNILTCIELGYNGWENSHICQIAQKLEENRSSLSKKMKEEAQKQMDHQQRVEEEEKIRAEQEHRLAEQRWLEEQKLERAEIRLKEAEDLARAQAIEKERKRQEEERQLLEEKRAQEAAKKKKKKSKKKKKA